MLKDLNWRPLDQRRIYSRLVVLYKVTHDLVAIPASQYLTRNTRLSRHIHPLSYRQISTLKNYYRFSFSQGQLFIGIRCQPTYQSFPPWRSSAALFAMSLLEHQFLFLPFNYTNTLFTLHKLISPPPPAPLFHAFISSNPFNTWFTGTRLMPPTRELRGKGR